MNWRETILKTAVPVIFGITAGVLSGWYTGKMNTFNILTVDMKGITADKKSELVKKFRENATDPNTASAIETEYADFLAKLDKALDPYLVDKKTVILRKEAIIDGKYKDITEEITAKVKKKEAYAGR